jgi:hypothetical protein
VKWLVLEISYGVVRRFCVEILKLWVFGLLKGLKPPVVPCTITKLGQSCITGEYRVLGKVQNEENFQRYRYNSGFELYRIDKK